MADVGGSVNLSRGTSAVEAAAAKMAGSFIEVGQAIDGANNKAASFVKVLESLGRGGKAGNIDKYISSLTQSTRMLSDAVANFSSDKYNLDFAEELVKSFAGFKAFGGDVKKLSSEMGEDIQKLANAAKSMAPDVARIFDVTEMQNAIGFMQELADRGIDVTESFAKMKVAADSGDLARELEEITKKVTELTWELNSAVAEKERLERELKETQGKNYSNIMKRNRQELSEWLVANNLAPNTFAARTDERFKEYFKMISDQAMTAQQAIRKIFQDFKELSGVNNSPIFENSENIERVASATEKEAVAVGNLAGQSNGVALITQSLAELFKAGSDATGDSSALSQSITTLVETLQKLGDIGDEKLSSIGTVLSAVSGITNSQLKESTFKNLYDGLNKLGSMSDRFDELMKLTRIDLRGFNDLSIKKASMENLSNNLPTIASINVDALERLANISWTNLNELKPGKAAMDNLKGLVDSMNGGAAIKEAMNTIGTTITESMQNIKIPITSQNFTGIEEAAIFIAETISEAITNAMAGAGSKAGGGSTFVHPVIESLRVMKKELEQTGAALKSMGADDPFGTEQLAKFNSLSEQLNRKIRDATKGQDVTTDYIGKEIHSLSEVVAAHKKAADEREKAANQKAAAAKKEADEEEKAAKRAEKAQEKASINAERQKAAGDIAAAKTSVNKLLKEGYGADNYNADAVSHVREEYAKLLDMVAQLANADSEQYKNAVPGLIEQAQKVKELADAENNAAKARSDAAKVDASRLQLLDQVNKFMEEGSDAAQQNAQQLQELAAALEKPGQSADDIARLKKQFDELQKSEKNASKEMNGFVKGFDSILSRFTAANLVVKGFDWLVKQCKEMVTAVKEVDAAMTELKKVTDLTSEGYSQFYNNVVQTAQTIGASVSDTINASADFARLGFSTDEALEMANAALVYQHVGDQDVKVLLCSNA